jgi:hypothetical protein
MVDWLVVWPDGSCVVVVDFVVVPIESWVVVVELVVVPPDGSGVTVVVVELPDGGGRTGGVVVVVVVVVLPSEFTVVSVEDWAMARGAAAEPMATAKALASTNRPTKDLVMSIS